MKSVLLVLLSVVSVHAFAMNETSLEVEGNAVFKLDGNEMREFEEFARAAKGNEYSKQIIGCSDGISHAWGRHNRITAAVCLVKTATTVKIVNICKDEMVGIVQVSDANTPSGNISVLEASKLCYP